MPIHRLVPRLYHKCLHQVARYLIVLAKRYPQETIANDAHQFAQVNEISRYLHDNVPET